MIEPEKSKLVKFPATLRRGNGTSSISASEIRKWCNEQVKISQDEDEAYVIDFLICAESYDVEEQDLKIVVSTPRMFLLAKKFMKLVQTDSLYKLMWQCYPFLFAGASDADYVFHSFAVAITKGENAEDFEFMF